MYKTEEYKSWGIDYSILDDVSATSPKKKDVFNAFKYFKMNDTKLVIIGQDPYPNPDHAMGLSFSSRDEKTPASLRNVFKVLKESHGLDFKTNDLTKWALQGVLLLNCYLTFPNKPKVWERLIVDVLKRLTNKKIIYFLWGGFAQKLSKYINGICYNFVHPSPTNGNEFLECDHFTKADKYFKKQYSITKLSKKLTINGKYINPGIIWDLNFVKSEKLCIAFTDGSWRRKYGKASWAVYFPDECFNYTNLISGYRRSKITENDPYNEHKTNIMAEGMAIVKALEIFSLIRHYPYNIKYVLVTDCELWYKAILKGYKFKQQWHRETLDKIYDILMKVDVDLYHITSHDKVKKPDESYEKFYDTNLNNVEQKKLILDFKKHNIEVDTLATQLTT